MQKSNFTFALFLTAIALFSFSSINASDDSSLEEKDLKYTGTHKIIKTELGYQVFKNDVLLEIISISKRFERLEDTTIHEINTIKDKDDFLENIEIFKIIRKNRELGHSDMSDQTLGEIGMYLSKKKASSASVATNTVARESSLDN